LPDWRSALGTVCAAESDVSVANLSTVGEPTFFVGCAELTFDRSHAASLVGANLVRSTGRRWSARSARSCANLGDRAAGLARSTYSRVVSARQRRVDRLEALKSVRTAVFIS